MIISTSISEPESGLLARAVHKPMDLSVPTVLVEPRHDACAPVFRTNYTIRSIIIRSILIGIIFISSILIVVIITSLSSTRASCNTWLVVASQLRISKRSERMYCMPRHSRFRGSFWQLLRRLRGLLAGLDALVGVWVRRHCFSEALRVPFWRTVALWLRPRGSARMAAKVYLISTQTLSPMLIWQTTNTTATCPEACRQAQALTQNAGVSCRSISLNAICAAFRTQRRGCLLCLRGRTTNKHPLHILGKRPVLRPGCADEGRRAML